MQKSVFYVPKAPEDVALTMASVSESLEAWEEGEALSLEAAMLEDKGERLMGRADNLMAFTELEGGAVIEAERAAAGSLVTRLRRLARRWTWWFASLIVPEIRRFQVSAASLLRDTIEQQEAIIMHLHRLPVKELAAYVKTLEARVEALESSAEDRAS